MIKGISKKNPGIRIKEMIKSYRQNMQALKQFNFTLKQLPNIVRERILWLRIGKNFKELYGSWTGGFTAMLKLFRGRPRKSR